MNDYTEIKYISIKDFKKLDIDKISFIQMETGERLIIERKKPSKKNKHLKNLKLKNKKEKKPNINLINSNFNSFKINNDNFEEKNYSLPNEYFKIKAKLIKRPKSAKNIKYNHNIIKDWKAIDDYDIMERLQFYDEIPEKAKYWENESFDASVSYFQEKRINNKASYQNEYNIYNYYPQQNYDSNIRENFNAYYNQNYNTIINKINIIIY